MKQNDKNNIDRTIDSIENNEEQPTPHLEAVRHYWHFEDVSKRIMQYEEINVAKAYHNFSHAIHPKKEWNVWKIAAAIAAAIIVAVLFIYPNHTLQPSQEIKTMLAKKIPVLSDSMPQIKLSNGQIIALNQPNTQINQQGIHAIVGNSSIVINTEEDSPVEMLELSIPRGCQYQVALPDGSIVTLNSGSKLRFPNTFKDKRNVILTGEAYFDVKKDGRPFSVTCPQGTIYVKGTTFNIKTYNSKQTYVTLYTGKVVYESQGQTVSMKPGDKLIQDGVNISLQHATTEEDRTWKEGLISFDDESLTDVMSDIERIYDVHVIYERNVDDLRFSGICKRNQSVESFMQIMGLTEEFEYEIQGKNIIIK